MQLIAGQFRKLQCQHSSLQHPEFHFQKEADLMAMTSAVQSKARTVLTYSNTVIERSNPSGGTDECPHFLYLCAVLCCVRTGLAMGPSPVQVECVKKGFIISEISPELERVRVPNP
jgi:hypothetical protein